MSKSIIETHLNSMQKEFEKKGFHLGKSGITSESIDEIFRNQFLLALTAAKTKTKKEIAQEKKEKKEEFKKLKNSLKNKIPTELKLKHLEFEDLIKILDKKEKHKFK